MDTTRIKKAINDFWKLRDGGKGVRSGKTMDGFVELVEQTVKESGLKNVETHTDRNSSQLPGYFRPHKSWDIVVMSEGKLIAAIEFKSQVGSIGNNANNRTEEALGSGVDLHTAIEENAFGDDAEIFTGYLLLLDHSADTQKKPQITMNYFPVMNGFLADESLRETIYKPGKDGKYPSLEGVSYVERYDMLCKRLVLRKIYTAAALILSSESSRNAYDSFSAQTSIETFIKKLENHCSLIASYRK